MVADRLAFSAVLHYSSKAGSLRLLGSQRSSHALLIEMAAVLAHFDLEHAEIIAAPASNRAVGIRAVHRLPTEKEW